MVSLEYVILQLSTKVFCDWVSNILMKLLLLLLPILPVQLLFTHKEGRQLFATVVTEGHTDLVLTTARLAVGLLLFARHGDNELAGGAGDDTNVANRKRTIKDDVTVGDQGTISTFAKLDVAFCDFHVASFDRQQAAA